MGTSMRILLGIVVSVVGLAAAAAQKPADLTPGRGSVTLRPREPRYRVVEVPGGRHRIEAEGYTRATEPGAPAVPFTVVEVEVPAGARREWLRLQVTGQATRGLPGRHRLEEPAPARVDRRHPFAVAQEEGGVAAPRGELFPAEPFSLMGVVTRWDGDRRTCS